MYHQALVQGNPNNPGKRCASRTSTSKLSVGDNNFQLDIASRYRLTYVLILGEFLPHNNTSRIVTETKIVRLL